MQVNFTRERRKKRRRVLINFAFTLFQGFGVLMSAITTYFSYFQHPDWSCFNYCGAIIFLLSYMLWFLARIQLGMSFSIDARASTLVTHGMYSRCRHPIYIFSTLGVAGYLMLIGKTSWLWFVLILCPVQWVRAQREMNVLREKFGQQYEDYEQEVWL